MTDVILLLHFLRMAGLSCGAYRRRAAWGPLVIARLAGAGYGPDTNDRRVATPELSPAEWQAVAIALQDAALGRRVGNGSPGLLTRLYRWATGDVPANGLADPRLEAVRSFVDRARRHRRIDERLMEPLFIHGFNARQVDALALLAA